MHGGLSGKRAADSRARALLPTIRELMMAGFVSQRALANELNRRRIPAAGGGRWHPTTVVRTVKRLGLITNGRINIALAHRQAADARAKSLASTIRTLQADGVVTANAIARALNEGEIPTVRRGRWHPTTVTRLLQRLKRLQRPSSSRHRR
jgi:hypothetical protein